MFFTCRLLQNKDICVGLPRNCNYNHYQTISCISSCISELDFIKQTAEEGQDSIPDCLKEHYILVNKTVLIILSFETELILWT